MIRQKLERIINNKCTLLGVGPMSIACTDATIELANQYDVPIMLIASRRQIDSKKLGGGYVNNWTTAEFSEYVMNKDKGGKIILARDHGGPWQNTIEKNLGLGLRKAMKSAKESFQEDILAGFQIIHIDPSVDIYGKPSFEEIIDRIFELYEFCWEEACEKKQEIIFEIGTEEQSGSTNSRDDFEHMLETVIIICGKNNLPNPFFVVAQNGTKVMETKNVGSFDYPMRIADELPPEIQVPIISKLCMKYGINMKAHNTDYLSNESLQWYPRLGIHAANIAPEFGVIETRSLINILRSNNLETLAEKFIEIAYSSKKWDKWMLKDSLATDYERAIIAGHYVFATEECMELKEHARIELRKNKIDLDEFLKEEVKKAIMRYLKNFRLVR